MKKKLFNLDKVSDSFMKLSQKTIGKNLKEIYFFGSRANGNNSYDSDYDFLIETLTPVSDSHRDALADIAIDITAENGVLLDVHYYTSKQISSFPYKNSPFIKSVVENGIRLCH